MYKTPIALAVAALCVSPLAFAEQGDGRHHHKDGAQLSKELDIEKDVAFKGTVDVGGLIDINANAEAVIDDEQVNVGNSPVQKGPDGPPVSPPVDLLQGMSLDNHHGGPSNGDLTQNKAMATDNVLREASGNVGVNITAGDNNQQANAAALAATDASFVFGSADSEIFAKQLAAGNVTPNVGKTNLAKLDSNVLQNASGNIGVNVSAGNSNQQKNDLAASKAVSRMADASVSVKQANSFNQTTNDPFDDLKWSATLGGADISLAGTYEGRGSGSYSGDASGTSTGVSDQIGDVFPDIWSDGDPNLTPDTNGRVQVHNEPGNTYWGHLDLDTQADARDTSGESLPQSVTDPSGDGGVLAFNNDNTYSGTETGTLGFSEAGDIALSGSASWWSLSVEKMWVPTTNTAKLSDNVLRNASGNIGVNIAAGTANQQYNGLAIAAAMVPASGGEVGGGTE